LKKKRYITEFNHDGVDFVLVSWEDDDENHMTSLIVHACGQVSKDPLHILPFNHVVYIVS
jgi:hypothetical protein